MSSNYSVYRYKFAIYSVFRYYSNMIKDTKIKELFGVPISTLQDMKKSDKDNWRYKVYTFLKSQTEEDIAKFQNSQALSEAPTLFKD